MLKDLIKKNRSYRRFYENELIEDSVLRELVDLARLSPTGGNLQPLHFYLSSNEKTNLLLEDIRDLLNDIKTQNKG